MKSSKFGERSPSLLSAGPFDSSLNYDALSSVLAIKSVNPGSLVISASTEPEVGSTGIAVGVAVVLAGTAAFVSKALVAAAEKSSAEKAKIDRVATEKAEAERIEAEKAAAEKAAAEKAEVERIAAEKAAAEKAAAEKVAAEKAEAERMAAEKAAAERAAAEKLAATEEAMQLLRQASNDKTVSPDDIYNAIRYMEKLLPAKRKDAEDAKRIFENLSPNSWQLILTTGDLETQKTLGPKIKYIPVIEAVQLFDGTQNPPFIRNGVYFSKVPLAEFEGVFRWFGDLRRLEFDFKTVKVFGNDITGILPDTVKKSAGLLLDGDSYTKQPAFSWIEVDDAVAIARGAGGGVALWKKVE